MTKSCRKCDSPVMMSSVTPSLKYSCSGSPLMLAKGRTAIDGFSCLGSCSGDRPIRAYCPIERDAIDSDLVAKVFQGFRPKVVELCVDLVVT